MNTTSTSTVFGSLESVTVYAFLGRKRTMHALLVLSVLFSSGRWTLRPYMSTIMQYMVTRHCAFFFQTDATKKIRNLLIKKRIASLSNQKNNNNRTNQATPDHLDRPIKN
jgi:hypothetical protein